MFKDINDLFTQEQLTKRINKSGVGHCVYLPKQVLNLYGLRLKDEVHLKLTDDGILIQKVAKK